MTDLGSKNPATFHDVLRSLLLSLDRLKRTLLEWPILTVFPSSHFKIYKKHSYANFIDTCR